MGTEGVTDAALQRCAGLSCWTGPVDPEPLPGGLSNDNFLVHDNGQAYAVRIGDDAPEHAVYRFNEITVAQAAEAAGLSPPIVHHEPGALVMDYIEGGRPLDKSDIGRDDMLPRIVELIRDCHLEMPRHLEVPGPMFWVFQVNRRYARILVNARSRMADRLRAWLELNDAWEETIGAIRPVFAHNDLLAANIIDDGQRLWLIDWEYGGWNTPLFDLANLASNNELPPARDAWLLQAYFETPADADRLHAFRAMKCASLLRELLWSLVTEIYSTLSIDFAAYSDDLVGRLDTAIDDYRSGDG